MQFLFLACDFPPAFGGIQKLSYGLCRGLQGAGHDVEVIAAATTGDGEFDRRSPLSVRRHTIKDMLRGALVIGGAVRGSLADGGVPDVVVATKWAPEGPGYIRSGVGDRAPMVLMGHGREFLPEPGRRLRAWVQRRVIGACAGAVANSRFTATQLAAAGVPEGDIRVVHPAIDPEELAPPADLAEARDRLSWPEGPTILTTARLVERKGVDTVLRALPRVASRIPDVHYMVIGDGPQRARLVELAAEVGVTGRVRFMGSVSEEQKVAALHLCDVFTMSSRDIPADPPEGFGIVYLEANACGKPVVAARTGGVADAVEDGVNGLLVEPNAPEPLAEALTELLGAPDRARELGETGRRRTLERFSWEVVAPQFAEAVSSILGGPS